MGTQKSATHKQMWMGSRIDAAVQMGISLNEEKLIAEFCLANVTTIKTAKEILRNMELTGKIKRVDGEIMSNELMEEVNGRGTLEGIEDNPSAIKTNPS